MTQLRRINLLPPEVEAERSQHKVKVFAVGSSLGLLVLLVFVFLVKNGQIDQAKADLEAQKQENEKIEAQINSPELQAVVQKKSDFDGRIDLLAAALSTEVAYPRMLNDLARVVPDQVWLTSLTVTGTGTAATGTAGTSSTAATPSSGGQAAPSDQAAQGGSAGGGAARGGPSQGTAGSTFGTVQIEAAGTCGMQNSADWLDRITAVGYFRAVWVSNAAKEAGAACQKMQFSTNAVLDATVLTVRAQRLAQGELP
jgi:hypothetical protein